MDMALDFFMMLIPESSSDKLKQKMDRGDFYTTFMSKPDVLGMVNASDGSLGYWTNTGSLHTHPEFACDLFAGWTSPYPIMISMSIKKGSQYTRLVVHL